MSAEARHERTHPMPRKRTVMAVHYLRLHNITAMEILYVPFLALTTVTTWQTSHSAVNASPLYRQMERVAPLNVWLAVTGICAIAIITGVLTRRLALMMGGYVVSATVWLTVAGLIYNLTHTYQTLLIYAFVGFAAIYRASDVWVQRIDAGRAACPHE